MYTSRIPQLSRSQISAGPSQQDSGASGVLRSVRPSDPSATLSSIKTSPDVVLTSSHQTSESQSPSMSTLSDGRKRQSRRDEAIRKKIATDLEKKRGGTPKRAAGAADGFSRSGAVGTPGGAAGARRAGGTAKAGTVSALRPTPALTVPQQISVADASQLCAAKRTDCVLVVDDDEHLCGIFTAKDLAFRVVGEGLDPRNTPVRQIMTPNPMVTRDTTSATDALQTMVQKHFRHLPVCNEEGDVVGLLDITKVFHESLEKLERAYGSSQKLYSALEGVQSEWGPNSAGGGFGGANGLMSYVEALREKMSFPDLGSILDARTRAVTVTVKTSVKEAARLMRENRTTAVCVLEDSGRLAGIFTSKDVVLRVIAAGLDAKTCSVVRVMTPHPDTGTPAMTIQQALRKMNDGRFLNLPVLEEDGTLAGCVDVLKLTYATLEQVSSIGAEAGGDAAGGPLWSRFFTSFTDAGADGDTESVVSESHGPASSIQAASAPSAMPKHLLRTDSAFGTGSSVSDIHPNDSASVVNEDEDSEVGRPLRNGRSGGNSAPLSTTGPVADLPHDDGTYLFKFLSPGGTTHRFVARYDNFSTIRDIVSGKLSSDPLFLQYNARGAESGTSADPTEFMIHYTDDEGDLVLMSADGDLEDSVKTARKQGKDRVLLVVKGGRGWEDAVASAAESASVAGPGSGRRPLKAVLEIEHRDDDDDDEDSMTKTTGRSDERNKLRPTEKRRSAIAANNDLVFGFLPKDMALPAAIAFTGLAVISVFLLSRPSHK